MVSRQHTYREVAACLGVTSGTVSNWVGYFERGGYEGLLTKPRSGRPAELTEEELVLLDDLVDAGALACGFPNDLWDTRRVASVICSHFGVSYHPLPITAVSPVPPKHWRLRAVDFVHYNARLPYKVSMLSASNILLNYFCVDLYKEGIYCCSWPVGSYHEPTTLFANSCQLIRVYWRISRAGCDSCWQLI